MFRAIIKRDRPHYGRAGRRRLAVKWKPFGIHTLLERLVQLLESIDRSLDRQQIGGEYPTVADFLVPLLREISASINDAPFSVNGLLNDALEWESQLTAAVIQATGDLDTGTSRRVGELLARAAGHEVAGFIVDHLSDDADGAVWRVRQV
jgi:hypothetical protein